MLFLLEPHAVLMAEFPLIDFRFHPAGRVESFFRYLCINQKQVLICCLEAMSTAVPVVIDGYLFPLEGDADEARVMTAIDADAVNPRAHAFLTKDRTCVHASHPLNHTNGEVGQLGIVLVYN